MKQRISGTENENYNGQCDFVDPGPFLSKLEPVPKWHQECKDFIYKHILQTVDFDNLSEGFQSLLEEIKRFEIFHIYFSFIYTDDGFSYSLSIKVCNI